MLQAHCSAQLSKVRKYGGRGKKVKMAMMEDGRNCNLAQNSINQCPLNQANCLGQMTEEYKMPTKVLSCLTRLKQISTVGRASTCLCPGTPR